MQKKKKGSKKKKKSKKRQQLLIGSDSESSSSESDDVSKNTASGSGVSSRIDSGAGQSHTNLNVGDGTAYYLDSTGGDEDEMGLKGDKGDTGFGQIQLEDDNDFDDRLKSYTKIMREYKVFGVPTFVYKGEIFWGQDRIYALKNKINE